MKLRKRLNHEPSENHERWLVSYADFITLLFAFFAVLYATSEQNMEKAKGFEDSIQKYLIKTGALGASGQEINQGQVQNSPIEHPIPTYNEPKKESAEKIRQIEVKLEDGLGSEKINRILADLNADHSGIRLSLVSSEIFAKDSTLFRPEAIGVLRAIASSIPDRRMRLMVENRVHSSSNASSKNNWDFAMGRATTLARYFIKEHNWAGNQVSATVLGSGADESESAPANKIDLVITSE